MVALSGGVDSMAAARILMETYQVFGMTLKLHEGFDEKSVKKLCRTLGLPLKIVDGQAEFEKSVICPFVKIYEQGETPNPCILCNQAIKFPLLSKAAEDADCDKIATGHYARVEQDGERWLLKRAIHREKDQSYVLSVLKQDILKKLLLPLGNMTKEQVREKARGWGLKNADTPDSQDICFIPDGDYAAYLIGKTGKSYPSGIFTDMDGKELGKHKGMIHYTIGQRRGLGLPLGYHAYVVSKDVETNRITVGREENLYTHRVLLKNINLIPFDSLSSTICVQAKTRYSAKESQAFLTQTGEESLVLQFTEAQRAVTPGQTAVFYDGDVVIGEGEICQAK